MFIHRRYNRQVRYRTQISHVKNSVMSRPVFAYQSGTVETKDNRQVLDSYIVDDIIISPLHERRIDVAERLQTVFCHTSGEGDGVSFGNSYIESPFRHFRHQYVHRTATGHGRGNTYNFRIGFGQFHKRISENILKERRHSFRIGNKTLAGDRIELAGRMPFGSVHLCRGESFSFYGM